MADGWTGVTERDPTSLGYEARRPWRFQCSEPNCYYSVSAKDEADARSQEQTHKCPHWGGQTRLAWNNVTRTLVQQMWDLLDEEMDGAMKDIPGTKIRARAIAECVAIFMPPFFTSADEVAKEALKRYKAKQAGEEYETPGIGARKYERPGLESKYDGWYKAPDGGYTSDALQAGLPANKKRGGKVQTVSKPVEHHFTEKEIEAINYMTGAGGFSAEQLATTYGVSVDAIKTVLI